MKNPETVTAVRGFKESFKNEDESSFNLPPAYQKSKSTIRRDARIIKLLKQECQRNDSGAKTLQEVFQGLLSVHNPNLKAFTHALQMEGSNGSE